MYRQIPRINIRNVYSVFAVDDAVNALFALHEIVYAFNISARRVKLLACIMYTDAFVRVCVRVCVRWVEGAYRGVVVVSVYKCRRRTACRYASWCAHMCAHVALGFFMLGQFASLITRLFYAAALVPLHAAATWPRCGSARNLY